MTKFLMCKPTHLHEISYKINPFMKKGEKINNELAMKQHADLVRVLEENGAEIEFIEQEKGLIDMIYTANAGLVYEDKFILSNFKNLERRPEVQHYMKWAREKGYNIVSLSPDVFFEGKADIAWIDDKNCFMAYGDIRTNERAIEELQKELKGVNIIPLKLVDERFYHLDTCLKILENKEIMYFRKAFDEESQKKIEKEASQRFTLTEEEALWYLCNSVKFGRKLVMHKCLWVAESYLNYEKYTVQKVDISELRKGGGSVECMVLEIGK
jgi:N-dimethylarginine dimethylaminohydrolase